MPREIKQSVMGGMNLDDSYHMIGANQYPYAFNITRDAVANYQDLVATNIVGNRSVSYSFPAGTNTVIGKHPDRYRGRMIYFVWNSNGNHSILQFSSSTRTISKIFESKTDSGGVDILGWDVNTKINHADVLYREEGDLLYFTDGLNSPKGFDIQKVSSGYYGVVEMAYIEAAKWMPLQTPFCDYGDDPTRNVNALHKKLYQFKYRWVFDDYSKSTWSLIGNLALPKGVTTSDVDIDNTKNNYINVSVNAGKKNVVSIEVAFRQMIAGEWSDFNLAQTLNKSLLGILDESTYVYTFTGIGIYPAINIQESILNFDWVPLKAKSQALVNGNVLTYWCITEGRNPITATDVTVSVEYIINSGANNGEVGMTWTDSGNGLFIIRITGPITTGNRYRVYASISDGMGGFSSILLSDYTVQSGNTSTDVYQGLNDSTPLAYQDNFGATFYSVQLPAGSVIYRTEAIPASGLSAIFSASTWLYNSLYKLGLVYFDEQGRTNGVVYNDVSFDLKTGNIEIDTGIPKTPVVNTTINHLPPDWAVKFSWVRTKNLSVENFIMYVTCDFQQDTDYFYFCLGNVSFFYDKNNHFNYSNIENISSQGARIRILCGANTTGYNGIIYNEEYEVLGDEQRQLTGGSASDLSDFLKVKKPANALPNPYTANMLVMVYSPATTAVSPSDNVFYEFGQSYDIYTVSGVKYHRGQLQDQDATHTANFRFVEGDTFYHPRTCYYDILSPVQYFKGYLVMDRNYNDYYPSSVNSNGRPQTIDINARETFLPATVRFGQEYITGTNINGLNRFYYENFDDYDRSYGEIRKVTIREKFARVFQQFKVGYVPVESQLIKSFNAQGTLVVSDRLLNPINYYVGDFGIGDAPESVASYNFSDYFCDTTRGIVCRVSQDGVIPLSILYKGNSWSTAEIPKRKSNYKIYGTYDPILNNYIMCFTATNDSPAYTLTFDEQTNQFESFLSYYPEMIGTLDTIVISFYNGVLWTHDSNVYNNFYGVQYPSYLTLVFNRDAPVRKKYLSLGYHSNKKWYSPTIGDVKTNTQNEDTGLYQVSNIVDSDLEKIESIWTAAFNMDANTTGDPAESVNDGDALGGNYLEIKFYLPESSASELVHFEWPYINYIISQRNF